MRVKLVSVGSDAKAAEIDVELPTVVGRGKRATLSLPHPAVSRRHCELFDRDGKVMVRDLGSLNGTYVGSQRVSESEVPLGELLTIATLSFRVVFGDLPASVHHESPLLTSVEDSTHGVGDIPQQLRPPPHVAPPPSLEIAPPGKLGREASVERDTQWQMGAASRRDSDDEGEDLSRLLNGR